MQLRAFTDEMEALAPPALAEEFDTGRIGLVIEGTPEITKICCALDPTPAVVRQAVAAGADMLVVHHTPLWTPLTSLTGLTAALMREILKGELNVYVMHTNFDRAAGGVNDALAGLLGMTDCQPLSLGLVGQCTLTVPEIAHRLGGNLRIWGDLPSFRQLAIVAGSGFDLTLMEEAQALGAEAFLSAEMKLPVARAAPLPCIESTHYALEAPAMRSLAAEKGWQYIDDPPRMSVYP
ncbi:Nif3-like dinuclear metal center hexameric protein [Methanoregula sp.]|uniref:Nif3-like dinuclear metal center hexameric protein n=1 Tax=Methanoregula sp. TaxID=2052170 RepID=UPI002BF50DD9|nr:Nif3-like dinuclear metal center hexameric protein [Methanoregula sp.]HVP96053.1 Nif3-like dinuclear metal center hexameric protein [Methanoregula sp.]